MTVALTRRALLAAPAAAPAGIADPMSGALGALVRVEAQADRFSGVVAVARGDAVLLEAGFGPAEREWAIPATTDTRLRIGSLTKPFTAVLILRLAGQGRLSVADALGDRWAGCPPAWRGVTLHQLLTHTGGVPNLQALPDFETWQRLPATPASVARRMAALPLDFPPGSDTRYSNTGYIVLGLVAEQAGGKPYPELLRREVLEPAGLGATRVDDGRTLIPHRALGYQKEDGAVRPAAFIDMGVPGPAGALSSTAGDLLRFARALFGGDLLAPDALARMMGRSAGAAPYGRMPDADRPAIYAYGLRRAESALGPEVFHSGSVNGFRAYLRRHEALALTVVALSNAGWADVAGLTRRLAEVAAA